MQPAENASNEIYIKFWNSACNFYEKNTSQILLLKLQNSFGISVNRLLFCCWFSQCFKKVFDRAMIFNEPEIFAELESAVAQLRKTRQNFEAKWKKPIIGNYNMARYHLLEGELALEKESQSLLVSYYCVGKNEDTSSLDEISLDFLITENIERLCLGTTASKLISQELRNEFQQLSLNWIAFDH